MFLNAAEKGVPLLDEATVAAIRAKVQAQYPNWNPDRMTMDYQPGDALFQQLLFEAAGVQPYQQNRAQLEQQAQANASGSSGGNAGLLLAAAAAYFLLG